MSFLSRDYAIPVKYNNFCRKLYRINILLQTVSMDRVFCPLIYSFLSAYTHETGF